MTGDNLPERIRDYYEDPYHRGRCESLTHCGEANNESCGDVVAVELRVVDDRVAEIWFDGQGCKISQGAASIFAEHFEGCPVDEIKTINEDEALSAVSVTASRTCVLVGFHAIQKALEAPIMEGDSTDPTFSGPDLGDEC